MSAIRDALDAYQGTVQRLEPDIHPIDAGGGWASVAISLKRIADALDKLLAMAERAEAEARQP